MGALSQEHKPLSHLLFVEGMRLMLSEASPESPARHSLHDHVYYRELKYERGRRRGVSFSEQVGSRFFELLEWKGQAVAGTVHLWTSALGSGVSTAFLH